MFTECRCTVVILNYNKRTLLRRNLEVVRDARALPYDVEVVVVDNASIDGSAEMVRQEFPMVRLIASPRNVGVAQGRNLGLLVARGEYILSVDEDTIVTPQQLDQLIGIAAAHPDAGIVAGMKVHASGAPLYDYHVPSPSTLGVGFFLVNELSLIEMGRALKRLLRLGDRIPHQTRDLVEIPYIGGGMMLVRRRAFQDVGPMDDRLFIFGEDFDWCYRFRKQGWKILYAPQVRVLSGFGVNATRTRRASLIALQSRRHLFEKHVGRKYLPIYVLLAGAGLLPKLAYYLGRSVRGRAPQDISIWEWFCQALRCIVGRGPRTWTDPPSGSPHVP